MKIQVDVVVTKAIVGLILMKNKLQQQVGGVLHSKKVSEENIKYGQNVQTVINVHGQ